MERQRATRKSTRFKMIPLVLIAIVVVGLILSGQLTKQGSGLSPALGGGKDEGAVHVSSDDENDESLTGNDKFKIMIDAGHGGKDPGAEGHSGTFEKVSNLGIARKLYDILRNDPSVEVRMTRNDDTFVKLEDRSAMANDWHADVFVSIHGNSYEDDSVTGHETFYRYDNGLPLAESIHDKLVDEMGFKDRGIRLNELKVLTLSQMPSVLIETGYLSNPAEEATLLSDEGQTRMAQAIADGLKAYAENIGRK